jgi:transposase
MNLDNDVDDDVTLDSAPLVERVAALDIGKAEICCCVRVPAGKGGREQQVRTFSTMTRDLLRLGDWLVAQGVTVVVMEATSDYWRPPFYLLEDRIEQVWLVNAADVKHLPGRPKTDTLDAIWLCKLAERGMLRASFVPPPATRALRDLTRYRAKLATDAASEKNRVEKLLESALIKVSVVASDIFGVSGRAMLHALIEGERDPHRLADLARGRLRKKTPALVEALTGRFTDHHAWMLTKMLARIDQIDADIADLDTRIEDHVAPFAPAVAALDDIPGISPVTAAAILAEIGTDMTRFPTAGHLTSWAGLTPVIKESAGRRRAKARTRRGDTYLARALGQAVNGLRRGNSFLAHRYRRLARRIGKLRAIVAVSRTLLTIIWHLLTDPTQSYTDLGADYYDRHIDTTRRTQRHVRDLQALGYRVTLEPVA